MGRTIEHLSYGLGCPADLLRKLRLDGEKIVGKSHPYDIFNFMITAAVMVEWIQNFYGNKETFRAPGKDNSTEDWLLPEESASWILDPSCIPNPHHDFKRHISNALQICFHTANASKHFHWKDKAAIKAIDKQPRINSWYQWTFTSREEDLYIDFHGEHYGLQQVKGIVIQFYEGLIGHLDALK